MTDGELLRQYIDQHSGDAMCELVRRYSGMVHAAALREVRDAHLADDITQAVFLVLMRRAASLSPKVILGGWLFKTTCYAAADARRQRAARVHHEREASRMPTDPYTPDASSDLQLALNDALLQLSSADRNAIILRYLHGKPAAEVALALGTTEVTARQRLSRALDRLRKHLARKGVTIAAIALVAFFAPFPAHAAPPSLLQHLDALAHGKAPPSDLSQSFAKGVHRMFRQTRIKRTAAASALITAVALAIAIPLALSATSAAPAAAPQPQTAAAAATPAPAPPLALASVPTAPAPATTPTAPPADAATVQAAATANTAFAADLYQTLLKDSTDKNLFISPYSISTILTLTASGAGGTTADQMKKLLHISDLNAMNAGIADISRQLSDTEGGQRPYQLYTANALWGDRRYPVVPAFQQLAEKYYGTEGLTLLDFEHNPDPSRLIINKWVEDQTKTRIKNLLPDKSITADTAMVLTNALYFKGAWQFPFSPNATVAQPFHVAPGKDVTVALMRDGGNVPYFENDDFQAISLPYSTARAFPINARKATSMFILLPKKPGGLADLEKKLTPENIAQWTAAMRPHSGSYFLPKFTITSPTKLTDILKESIPLAFDQSKADFRDLVTPPPGNNVWIADVFHKAFINVDEEGTEAAAATAVVMAGGGGPPQNPFTFRADHPFFFAIRYEPTNSILFMGHLIEPSAAPADLAATPRPAARGRGQRGRAPAARGN